MNKFSITKDISIAKTLPPAFYTSDKVFERGKDTIFAATWHWAGDSKMLGPQTNVHPFIIYPGFLDEPALLSMDDKGIVHALSNVCTHRGNLVANHDGKQKKLICGYHGRRFALDGSFEFMPEFDQAKDFPTGCDHLPKLPLGKWAQFLFVSLTPAFPFEEISKILEERVGFLPVEDFIFRPELSRDYLVNAHWALYCDNYLEGFHIPFVHNDLNAALDYGTYESLLFDYCNVQIGYAKGGTETFDLPAGHPDHGKQVVAFYFWIFPNLMLNFYPWGLSVNIVKPLSRNKSKVTFLTYMFDETKKDNSAGALLDKVEREDEFVVENVQKGLNSRTYKAGRFSPKREKGVHHFHSLLAKFMDS